MVSRTAKTARRGWKRAHSGYSPWRMAWLADRSLDISDEAESRDLATRGVLQCLAAMTLVIVMRITIDKIWNTIKPMASANSGGWNCWEWQTWWVTWWVSESVTRPAVLPVDSTFSQVVPVKIYPPLLAATCITQQRTKTNPRDSPFRWNLLHSPLFATPTSSHPRAGVRFSQNVSHFVQTLCQDWVLHECAKTHKPLYLGLESMMPSALDPPGTRQPQPE